MARRLRMMEVAMLMAVVAAAAVVHDTTAEEILVGGPKGWNVATDFVEWAKKQTINVGDTLVFVFTKGAHDVASASKEAYDECNLTKVGPSQADPPVKVKINSTAPLYFLCTVPLHCRQGQKVAITVSGEKHSPASSPTAAAPSAGDASLPPGSVPASAAATNAPAKSGAPSLRAAVSGFSAAALTVVAAGALLH